MPDCLQCHDLPGSHSSSPLSQMDSYAGRSMDPLLPLEPGRKKVPNNDYDVTQRHHSERHRTHVCGVLSISSAVRNIQYLRVIQWLQITYFIIPGAAWGSASRASSHPASSKSGRALRPRPELASLTGEAHLRILCLRIQCKLTPLSFLNDPVST